MNIINYTEIVRDLLFDFVTEYLLYQSVLLSISTTNGPRLD